MTDYARFSLKVNGAEMNTELQRDVMEIVVDTNLHLPDMFSIQLHDDKVEWVDDSRFDLGKSVEILVDNVSLIKGEITSIEPEFGVHGRASLMIRGYDKSHRLHRGRKTRTFLNQGDTDIAKKVASEAGLSIQADSAPSGTHEYVIQNNQTDMEFLLTRAQRIGFEVYDTLGTLHFVKCGKSRGNGPDLEWGANLRSFQPRWVGPHQTDKFVVNGWDDEKKQVITAKETPNSSLNQGGATKTGGAAAKSAFQKSASSVVVSHPVSTPDAAKAMAKALRDNVGTEYFQAEGLAFGEPTLQAGYKVKVERVGTRFSGNYYVTAASHIYRDGLYETVFTVSGRHPNTISHLLESGTADSQGFVRGVVIGLVTNNVDKKHLGRVKVKYPWMGKDPNGAEIESHWARMAPPSAGQDNKGFYYLPEINDEVLLAFEHGDMNRPYIIGTLWSNPDKPPKPNNEVVKSGKVNERIIQSRTGHVFIFDDTAGDEKIIIRDKTKKQEVIILAKDNSMTINVGQNYELNTGGKMTINSKMDSTIDSKAKVIVKSQATTNIESQAPMTIKSNATMKIQSIAPMNIECSAPIQIKASMISVKADGMLNLEGAVVNLKGSGIVNIQGGLVKIN